jgi:hypothetical protein
MTAVELLALIERLTNFNAHLDDDETITLKMSVVRSIQSGFEELVGIARAAHDEVRHLMAHLNGEEHEHLSPEEGVQV